MAVERQAAGSPPRTALLAAGFGRICSWWLLRGHGGVEAIMLGSVNQALLHHAPCPVGSSPPACPWTPKCHTDNPEMLTPAAPRT